MKKLRVTILFLLGIMKFSYALSADERPSNSQEAISQVIGVATHYIQATACDSTLPLSRDNVAVIEPWSGETGMYRGKYFVVWQGNPGCVGGTAGYSVNITLVNVAEDFGNIYVEPDNYYVSGGAQISLHKVIGGSGDSISALVTCGLPLNILKCTSDNPINVKFVRKAGNDTQGPHWDVEGEAAEKYFEQQDPSNK